MKPFYRKTPLERAQDHNDQVKRGYYVQQHGGGAGPSTSSPSSSGSDATAGKIRELNAQENEAWKAGNTQAAKALSERAFSLSRSQINANMHAQGKSGCLVILIVPILSLLALYLLNR